MNDKHLNLVTEHNVQDGTDSSNRKTSRTAPNPRAPHIATKSTVSHNRTVSLTNSTPSVPKIENNLNRLTTTAINRESSEMQVNTSPSACRATFNPNACPQIIYLPQQPAPVQPEPLTARRTCHELVTRSVVHIWYLVYISFLVFAIYSWRLPAWNENLKLQIELAKLKMQEEEFRSHARIREAEIHRDLTLDVGKLRLANEHDRKMESLKISKALAEKFLELNTEVKEKSSGMFNRESTTLKRTYLEVSDAAAFAMLFGGYTQWSLITENVSQKLLNLSSNVNQSEDKKEGEEKLEIFDEEF